MMTNGNPTLSEINDKVIEEEITIKAEEKGPSGERERGKGGVEWVNFQVTVYGVAGDSGCALDVLGDGRFAILHFKKGRAIILQMTSHHL